jgi:hypothetical protein
MGNAVGSDPWGGRNGGPVKIIVIPVCCEDYLRLQARGAPYQVARVRVRNCIDKHLAIPSWSGMRALACGVWTGCDCIEAYLQSDRTYPKRRAIMSMNVKMLLSATLASMISACVVPQDTDTPDSETVDQSLAVGSDGAPAPQDGIASVSARSLRESPEAAAASVNCSQFFPVINVVSYNNTPGQAIERFGQTFIDYANQTHRFVIGNNCAVYHTWLRSDGSGSGWENDGGFATSGVFAQRLAGGGLQICVRGSNLSTTYTKQFFPSTGWGSWTNTGTPNC